MKTELVDHPIFLQIKAEHIQIRSLMDEYKVKPNELSILQKIETLAEIEHHPKEENLLFSHLLNFEAVNSGGPLCMLYLDDYILNNPIDVCKKTTGSVPTIDNHLEKFFEKGSAMRIPINDHLGGRTILRFLIDNFENCSTEQRISLFDNYKRIQINHMEKEENCFFYVCANLLTQSSADEIYQKWINKGEPS